MESRTENTPDSHEARDEHYGRAPKPEPPAWQFYVTLAVALSAMIAFVVFFYGFCAMKSRRTEGARNSGHARRACATIRRIPAKFKDA